MIVPVNLLLRARWAAILWCTICSAPIAAQEAVRTSAAPSAETYRLRIENIQYGRIELSLDAGKHYLLVGRVVHAATAPIVEASAKPGKIVRSSSEGIALSALAGQVLKLRPEPSAASHEPVKDYDIVTNIPAARPLWGKYAAPAGSTVQLQPDGHEPGDFPEGYALGAADRLVICAALPLPDPPIGVGLPAQTDSERKTAFTHALRAAFESLAAEYRDSAVTRATAEKRKVASGILTLRPTLQPDEPDPVTAITYSIDDVTVCARTTAPYLFGWDTSTVNDGEHVIEVRALNAAGGVITKTRYLVVVKNSKDAAQ